MRGGLMQEWNSWLNGGNIKVVVKEINELIEEIREVVTNGSLLQEKDASKIAIDFTLSLGQIEGLRMAIDTIKDIKSIVESEEDNGN